MADWKKIKAEYITTDTSYRKLADKYGVDQTTVARRAKKENWVEARQQHADKTQAKILAADSRRKERRAERLQTVADKLMDKIEAYMDECSPADLDTQAFRHISATLKDLKEVQMVRYELDNQEQQARIDKLRREAQKDETGGAIKVILEGGMGDYAQ